MASLPECPFCSGTTFRYEYEIADNCAVVCCDCLARGPFKVGARAAREAFAIRTKQIGAQEASAK